MGREAGRWEQQAAAGGARRRRALLSVADKTGIVDLARALHERGWELVSTGGTAQALAAAGLPVTPVAQVTGFPELLGGRVKTLHPAIHAGILARRHRPDDMAALQDHGVVPVDLVAVNLYPFAEAAAAGATGEALREEIDIGGPALIRAAAKNWPDVIVLVDPADYPRVAEALAREGGVPPAVRRELAVKAFRHTAFYDAVIAAVLAGEAPLAGGEPWPEHLALPLSREAVLRYGENPHQAAALYRLAIPHRPAPAAPASGAPGSDRPGPAGFVQRWGKPMSYNNWLDALAAWRAVQDFALPAAVAIKHATPCGIGVAATPAAAFRLARDADPESIFGGIVAFNRPLDAAAAEMLAEIFLEVVVAPAVAPEALEILARRKNLRVLEADPGPAGHGAGRWEVRGAGGLWLIQEADAPDPAGARAGWRPVTRVVPTPEQWDALDFAWRAVKACRSNAIVVAAAHPAGGYRTLGIGAGQTSRVRAVEQALALAGPAARGAVLASDGFFPFPDSVERAAAGGIAAIVQPGGSVRDAEVIAAADAAGIAMVFTGRRHFRH
ncbi:bifunctional phosphoribosylaminoimidazolecarboxamide formyltransferase/IMP cyclohydrolase [Thermaerobacter marianensis]|uniref:bifunctional phosphoribosylaminoimidazolecarboxamide formyltransferase/IMP cyclohydrolase n=1 Tax=Thermaerobacter marianensis TaxID=73919 RepID=UPI0011D254C4|nr:bifunctional phosphoribosylaminoimidazolecarboxamide formyltransferase/IMP cyclohydrolase [Thermaerobacter marianensis]